MGDMLVKLYDLPDHSALVARLQSEGIEFRRAMPPEKATVAQWVGEVFGNVGWKSEVDRAINLSPPSCLLAVEKAKLVGFACYDATCKDFFGPTGVHPDYRKRGIGTALLWLSLKAMAEAGYSYAVIAWVSSQEFYNKACGAVPIPNSEPGFFKGMIKL